MSDRGGPRDPDETVAFSSGRGGPPAATQPLRLPGDPPPDRGRQILIYVLVLLLGLAGGFGLAQFFGGDDDQVPDEDLVLFENAGMSFPIEGAQFTQSTFDLQTQRCDRELLKQRLRADRHRLDAWLELQGITESELDSFIDRLETRILEEPTPVTNHGCFPDGEGPCPFEIQSVLGKGTPVWFDPQQDRIVAKCTCSNPIKPPKCPPNCEDLPTPSPSATPTSVPTATPTRTQPPRTTQPTVTPQRTAPPTTKPTSTPIQQPSFSPQPPA